MAADSALVVASGAAVSTYTLGNAVQAMASGTDPMVALLTYTLSSVPNPWMIVAAYLVWRMWGKDALQRSRDAHGKRIELLDKLALGQEKLDAFIARADDAAVVYQKTHTEVVPALARQLEDIHGEMSKMDRKCYWKDVP